VTAVTVPDMNLRSDAGMSAAALHLLLAQHPELVELPIVWQIEADAVIRPFLPVDHAVCHQAALLLAAALELELSRSTYTTTDGVLMLSLRVEGRWGGAHWMFGCYLVGATPAVS
jgi:hypothetical protein